MIDNFNRLGVEPKAMAIHVARNHHGNLRFRIYWRGESYSERAESSEGIACKDTPENRAKLKSKVDQINAEIKAGTFDYLKHFPDGNKASHFRKVKAEADPKTIRSYYAEWILKSVPPLAKRSKYDNYRNHFTRYILPIQGDKLIKDYGVADIRAMLTTLVATPRSKGEGAISIKTVKNVLAGSLRALFRDAAAEELIKSNPFDRLPPKWWPKHQTPPPDPFTEDERDEILNYLRKKFYYTHHDTCNRPIPPWPAGYVFAYTLFWAGMRPSELTARKWSDLDPRTGKLVITSSRSGGEEGPAKTAESNRTIQLFPPVLELILSLKPLRVGPDDYIFLDRKGQPIDHWYFGQQYFQAALTALKMRHRDFYHLRHSFISIMLTHGEAPKAIAEYCGNSPEMIFKHYARYLGDSSKFGAAAMARQSTKGANSPAINSSKITIDGKAQ